KCEPRKHTKQAHEITRTLVHLRVVSCDFVVQKATEYSSLEKVEPPCKRRFAWRLIIMPADRRVCLVLASAGAPEQRPACGQDGGGEREFDDVANDEGRDALHERERRREEAHHAEPAAREDDA